MFKKIIKIAKDGWNEYSNYCMLKTLGYTY